MGCVRYGAMPDWCPCIAQGPVYACRRQSHLLLGACWQGSSDSTASPLGPHSCVQAPRTQGQWLGPACGSSNGCCRLHSSVGVKLAGRALEGTNQDLTRNLCTLSKDNIRLVLPYFPNVPPPKSSPKTPEIERTITAHTLEGNIFFVHLMDNYLPSIWQNQNLDCFWSPVLTLCSVKMC